MPKDNPAVRQRRRAQAAENAPKKHEDQGSRGKRTTLVEDSRFIEATRDTGYSSTGAAVAELVDNALQAGASRVDVLVDYAAEPEDGLRIAVLDNGCGMDESRLTDALRFGGSERFGDRSGLGRFGMGLPNSSVSQARRVDVYSWTVPGIAYHTYLDVDEIAAGRYKGLLRPHRSSLPSWLGDPQVSSGTLVVWSRCDRVPFRRPRTVTTKLSAMLGRWYRYALFSGTRIAINGSNLAPIDPLYCRSGTALPPASPFGPQLEYPIRVPGTDQTSTVQVRFVEIPINAWIGCSVAEKRAAGIVGGPTVSVIRAGREIDAGWHFMGEKRRENYDDWWRCEITFEPELDELFGVTHSKQGISPTPLLRGILSSELEPIARTLNARVRARFAVAKGPAPSPAARRASSRDHLLPTAQRTVIAPPAGFQYRIVSEPLGTDEFFRERIIDGIVVLTLNSNHPFHERVYIQALSNAEMSFRFGLEVTLLAAVRALLDAAEDAPTALIDRLRVGWSDALAAFLS